MKIRRFDCEIIEHKDRFLIVPKNKLLRFFGVLPITNGKGDIINSASDWLSYKDAKWAYNNMMRTKYVEI